MTVQLVCLKSLYLNPACKQHKKNLSTKISDVITSGDESGMASALFGKVSEFNPETGVDAVCYKIALLL